MLSINRSNQSNLIDSILKEADIKKTALSDDDDEDFLLRDVGFVSKPRKWTNAKKVNFNSNSNDLSDRAIEIIKKLKVYTFDEVYGKNNDDVYPMDDFVNAPKEISFILKYNNKTYIVNTQGYTYCRYIAELLNF